MEERMAGSDAYARIYAAVERIPRGRVATYGQVAALAGLPGHARQVGYALHRTPDDRPVPWQRVLNANGEVALRADPTAARLQRDLLRAEGVRFRRNGTVDLRRYGWSDAVRAMEDDADE
jgi:methylated-DNA-protein-cysteine methyltransferase-like protein